MRMHRLSRCGIASIALLMLWLIPLCAQAAPGDVLSGEYVLILNTDLSNATEGSSGWEDLPQSSGTICFDDSADRALDGAAAADVPRSAGAVDSSARIRDVALLGDRAAPVYTLGQTKTIGSDGKNFTLAAIGTHCLIWMDDTVKNGYEAGGESIYTAGSAAAAIYDEKSYPVILQFDTQGYLDYADKSNKLSILLEAGISSGYFDYSDMFTTNGNVTAIHINAASLPTEFEGFGPLFAHECQHAVSYGIEQDVDNYQFMDRWLDEALSIAAMDVYTKGHDGNGWLNGLINTSDYLRRGGTFVYQTYPGYTEANYSMPFLFLRYLNTQANGGYDATGAFYSRFYQKPSGSTGIWRNYDAARVEQVLHQYSATADWNFVQALTNFYIAIQVQANEGVYGFAGDPVIARKVSGFPLYGGSSGSSVNIQKCGAIMVKTLNGRFTVPADAGADIRFIAFSPSAYQRGLTTAGTESDPHLVHDAETLSYIWDERYRSDHFLLTCDVEADAGYYDFWNDNYYNYYMDAGQRHWPDLYGVLDGGGHALSNMQRPLCKTNYGLIRDLEVTCALTANEQLTGALSCMNYGSIENCAVHGSITVPDTVDTTNNFYAWIGGISGDMRTNAASNYPARLSRCMSDVAISGKLDMYKYFYIGGLLGATSSTDAIGMTDCYSAAALSLRIKENLPGVVVLGGLVGDGSAANTQNCYSVANVSFTNDNGGDMSGKLQLGRVFGRASAYNAAYGHIYALNGLAACGGSYTPEALRVCSAEQLQDAQTYAGFDFDAVWEMPAATAAYRYAQLREELAILGDVTQDGMVSLADAIVTGRHIVGAQTLPAPIAALADLDGDGVVAVDDLLRLCRYLAGLLVELAA